MNCPTIPGFAQFSFQSWDWLNPEIDGICHSQPLITKMSHLSTEHKIGADLCTKYISNFHNNILGTVWAQFCLFYRHQNRDQGIRLKQILSYIKVKNLWSNSGQQICKCNAINRIVSSYKLEIKLNSSVAPKFQMPYVCIYTSDVSHHIILFMCHIISFYLWTFYGFIFKL